MATSTSERSRERCRIGFVMEQTLGHRAHYHALSRLVGEDPDVSPVWLPIEFAPSDRLARLPGVRSNWSARASLLAWRAVRRTLAAQPLDALFYHTQVTALLAPLVRAVPTVISLDATPRNYDTVGQYYGHGSGGKSEGVKRTINQRAFATAAALVTWCDWAKESLVDEYGVADAKITTIAPGVDLDRWPDPRVALAGRAQPGHKPRLLFVGGDFARKGGNLLLDYYTSRLADRCDLWLVTQSPVPVRPGVRVWRDIAPGSETLPQLYAEADIFVFPTLADCAPLVVPEAMAAALPVITTSVGAIPEMVRDGETGFLLAPGDGDALGRSLERLLDSAEMRLQFGEAARRVVEERYDARKNASHLLALLKDAANGSRATSPLPTQTRPHQKAAER